MTDLIARADRRLKAIPGFMIGAYETADTMAMEIHILEKRLGKASDHGVRWVRTWEATGASWTLEVEWDEGNEDGRIWTQGIDHTL